MPTSRPLKWYGGKGRILPWLQELLPPADSYEQYVEPYFGGGALLFSALGDAHEANGVAEVANDTYLQLTNFWWSLQSETRFLALKRRLEATPASEVEFWQSLMVPSENMDVQAAQFFVRYRMSRSAEGKTFSTLTKNRTGAVVCKSSAMRGYLPSRACRSARTVAASVDLEPRCARCTARV